MTAQVSAARPVTPASILAATLDRLVAQLQAGDVVDPAIAGELAAARDLAVGLDPYLAGGTTPESVALRSLAEATQAREWSGSLEQEMLSGHVEGQVLKMLVHLAQARRVLEIGMFTGYSALAMAEALPADGEVVACEIDADVAEFAQRCFAGSESGTKISVRVGPALATLETLAAAGESFDLVFIDADKAGYLDYLDIVLERRLLAPHAVICVDNTLMQGQPWLGGPSTANGEAIAAFNRVVAADGRVEQVIIPLRDGMTLIRAVGATCDTGS
jgi:caffeoyl-CoA O-methyltransferase